MKPKNNFFYHYHRLTISGIVLFAFLLRIVNLSGNPAGFFRDEADKGYTTFSLIESGMDQTGESWPLFVRALSVTTSALYQYIDIPFIAVFGLNEFAVRLPAVLAGTLSVLAAYWIARRWWGKDVGLWTALFVCLSSWSLPLSRWANQSILLTLWIPMAVYFLTRGKEKNPSWYESILSCLFMLLALYTYAPARLVVPVFALCAWICLIDKESFSVTIRKRFLLSFTIFWVIFLVGILPLAHHLLYESAESNARLSRITIFDGQPWHSLLGEWLGNYFLHFSPRFLLFQGDENLRHSTAFFGQLHLYLVPLVIVGIARCCIKRTKLDRILFIWLILFPIAAACTRESIPHALRSVFAIPVFQLLAGRGMNAMIEGRSWIKRQISEQRYRITRLIFYGIILLTVFFYIYDLHVLYPKYSAPQWEYGYGKAISWWENHQEIADQTLVTGIAEYPYIFFLFYTQYPPEQWIEEQQIDGVNFAPRGDPAEVMLDKFDGRLLILVRPHELRNLVPEKVIIGPNKIPYWKWVSWGKADSKN